MTVTAATALAFMGPFEGHAAFFPLFVIVPLFWIVVIVLLALLFGRHRRCMSAQYRGSGMGPRGHGGPWGPNVHTAESTLAERFANGDIDENDYRARLGVLRSQYPADPARS